VLAQILGIQTGVYLAIGWLAFCAALGAANWATIRLDLMAHRIACLALMLVIVTTLPVIWFCLMWLRRRKIAELNEVTKLSGRNGNKQWLARRDAAR
jgi:hypothetical protein